MKRDAKTGREATSRAATAKPPLSDYRRKLPHLQRDDTAIFVTFNTKDRWVLPEVVRGAVLQHALHDNGTKLQMHAVVVMPDHVHLLFTPLRDTAGVSFGMAEIMRSIKGASARSINTMLKRGGTVWQSESFDRLLRRDEGIRRTAEYICRNPVRAGLAASEDAYLWLWREWVEGAH